MPEAKGAVDTGDVENESQDIFTRLDFRNKEDLADKLAQFKEVAADWKPTSLDEVDEMEAFGDIDDTEPVFEAPDGAIENAVEIWRLWSITCPIKMLNEDQDNYEEAIRKAIESAASQGIAKYVDNLEISFVGGGRKNYDGFGEILANIHIPFLNRRVVISLPEEE